VFQAIPLFTVEKLAEKFLTVSVLIAHVFYKIASFNIKEPFNYNICAVSILERLS
jgi:hypothetical protein